MRQLTKQEREATLKGIERVKKELELAGKNVAVTQMTINHVKANREYEDGTREYRREIEDMQYEEAMKNYKSDLLIAQQKLKDLNDQLENGVEEKKPQGIG
jgi:putative cell wall-binding protein